MPEDFSPSIESRLEQLESMYKKKLVTEEEYQKKRKIILEQLTEGVGTSTGVDPNQATVASSEISSSVGTGEEKETSMKVDPNIETSELLDKGATVRGAETPSLVEARKEGNITNREKGILAKGDLIDKYKIVEPLDEGAMGMVYKVEHLKMSKTFALKVLHPHLLHDPLVKKRFIREVEVAMKFVHEHALQVRDYGETEAGLQYFTMDFSGGVSLKALLKKEGVLEEKRALRITKQVLSALKNAHRNKIIHRDLKPDNILIETRFEEDHALVLDFGIAKVVDLGDVTQLTQQGAIGTPKYMSPEQAGEEEIDARSDLYSLGIILYEMVTGKLPFTGSTLIEILCARTVKDPIPVEEANVKVSLSTTRIINKALQREKEDRFSTAEEFIQAIDSVKEEQKSKAKVKQLEKETEIRAEEQAKTKTKKMEEKTLDEVAREVRDLERVDKITKKPTRKQKKQPGPEKVIVVKRSKSRKRSILLGISAIAFLSLLILVGMKYKETIKLERLETIRLYNRGIVKRKQGDNAGAIKDFTEAIRINPKYAEAYNSRGIAKRKQEDNAGAIKDYDEAIRINPKYAWAYNNRGIAKYKQGDNAGAIKDYDKAIKLDPKYAEAYYNRGIAKRKQGDNAGAIKDLEHAAQIGSPAVRRLAILAILKIPKKEESITTPEGFRYLRTRNKIQEYVHEATGMEFVLVPGGSFQMGSSTSKYDDERPVHEVTVKSFLMSKHEVTQGVWRRIMRTTPWQGKDYVQEGDNYPAVYISWDDAKKFCSQTGLSLPSEAQWEYACRSGTKTKYYWGDNIDGRYLWYDKNAWDIGEKYAHKVGQKQPNAFGLYDMSGNVWEWCEDKWHDNYQGAPRDGSAWTRASSSDRLDRGGGFDNRADNCRSANRDRNSPGSRGIYLGLRVVRPVP